MYVCVCLMHVGKWVSFGVLAHGPGSLSLVEIGTTVGSRLWTEGGRCGELGEVWSFEVKLPFCVLCSGDIEP